MLINLVLLFCDRRTNHFGQGTFINRLLPYFESLENVNVVLVKTDCIDIDKTTLISDESKICILIPNIPGTPFLTGESNYYQDINAKMVTGILYEHLHQKENLIFWVNSIDYLNICKESKKIFKSLNILYVHHSFSWKYFLNISDDKFSKYWIKKSWEYHAKAFEMTEYQRQMVYISDRTITVTNHAKSFFTDILQVPKKKIKTIYNGSINQQLRNKNSLRDKYGFQYDDKILIVCGRVTKDKGIPDALKAFKILAAQYANLKLVIIGTGQIADFISLASPFWSRVIYTGELDHNVISDFYMLGDIGIIPSYHEQCSFTAIEMQFHNLPVITTNADGLNEMFDDNFNALKVSIKIDKNGNKNIDTNMLINKLDLLLNDKLLANKLTKNGLDRVNKIFSLSKMRSKYLRIMEDLVSLSYNN